MSFDFTSRQTLRNGEYTEECHLGGRQLVRPVPIPLTHVQWRRTGALRTYQAATGVLRLLVRLLYLFSALVVVKLVLFALGIPAGDWITVAFVVLVCALFASLVAVAFLFMLVGPRSERQKHGALELHAPGQAARKRLLAEGKTRVAGRVDAGLEAGATVLVEQWVQGDAGLERRVSGSSFVVRPDEGPPVVVELQGCPLLFLGADQGEATLRQGDRVELVGSASRTVTHLEDTRLDDLVRNGAPGLAPYRESDSTTLVVYSTPERPVVIHR